MIQLQPKRDPAHYLSRPHILRAAEADAATSRNLWVKSALSRGSGSGSGSAPTFIEPVIDAACCRNMQHAAQSASMFVEMLAAQV